jgi:hypothetical protein
MEFIYLIVALGSFVWAIAILVHFNVVINQLKKQQETSALLLAELKKQNC